MTITSSPPEIEGYEPSLKKIRGTARLISWFFAPLVIVSVAFWLVFTGVACWGGGDPLFWELWLCEYAFALPGLAAAGLYSSFALLFLELAIFFAWQIRADRSKTILQSLQSEIYRKVPASVMFAFEMTLWATATLVAILVFYFEEFSKPLGVLAILGAIRVVLALVMYIRRNRPGTHVPPMASPTT